MDVYLLCFAYVNRVSPSQTIVDTISVRKEDIAMSRCMVEVIQLKTRLGQTPAVYYPSVALHLKVFDGTCYTFCSYSCNESLKY